MLSPLVLAVVFLAAALHAGWNVAVRAGSDRRRESALLLGGGTLIGILVLPFLPLPPPACWPYLVFSAVLNGVFFIMIAEAYAYGGIALAYPLMRGVAPMITMLGSWLLLGEGLPISGGIGIAMICLGVVMLARRRGEAGEAIAVRYALLNAVVIAAYTMNDAIGVRIAQTPLAYALWLYPLSAMPALVWLGRKTSMRWPSAPEAARGVAGAGASIGAYSLVLWAMTQAPVAPVAALRETSILFGVVLARLLLGEQPGARGWCGSAAIAAGAAMLRLAA